MEVISTTPFGQRPLSAGLIAANELAQGRAPVPHIDKWELFRELCVARADYGVSDRDLTVLNALLSYHQPKNLSDNDQLIVFPSNKSLSERAHGMAESTLRRHIAALCAAGLITRHDSPNGKRYAAKDATGAVTRAFGFNLRPLLVQAADIAHSAHETRQARETLRRQREECSLILRDAWKLAEYGAGDRPEQDWEPLLSRVQGFYRILRRKLTAAMLAPLLAEIQSLLSDVQSALDMVPSETKDMSAKHSHSERHIQNSNTNHSDLEPSLEKERGQGSPDPETPHLPLALVLKACPDIQDYAPDEIRHWHELIAVTDFTRGMLGISPDAWAAAKLAMGDATAAITLAAILQRVDQINAPGGYLRALTSKAEQGSFSPGPMVMALLNGGSTAGQGRAA